MANRRAEIAMNPNEVRSFLEDQRTMSVATIGHDGRPHVVAMWYCFLGDELWFWTFAKSQKAVNLTRDPRLTFLVESGERYEDLRGVEAFCSVRVETDLQSVRRVGTELFRRYAVSDQPGSEEGFLGTAPKRVAVCVELDRVVSWDHRKLGGTY